MSKILEHWQRIIHPVRNLSILTKICTKTLKRLILNILVEIDELFEKFENVTGNRDWLKEWKNRENGKSESQKEKDQLLFEAAEARDWDDMDNLLNDGATPDYLEDNQELTAYYWTLYYDAVFFILTYRLLTLFLFRFLRVNSFFCRNFFRTYPPQVK